MVKAVPCAAAILLFAANCSRQDPSDEQPGVEAGGSAEARQQRALCDSGAICFTDTARVVDLDHEPGRDVRAHWLVFASVGDSIEFRVTPSVPDLHATISVTLGRAASFQERDASGNTASYVRFRSADAGAITASVSMDDGARDTVEYTLAVRHIAVPSTRRSLLLGRAAAGLTISSARDTDEFIIRPLSVAASEGDARRWIVFPRQYKVALTAESEYVICKMPCINTDTITLRPGERLTKSY